ncbi:TRAP transporter small permease subunit [Parasulfuritortus cantonensis]|uniref:TRAP transporter small permease protein n=1 Tax=Parasulfuritortus cantonensis TaxID=2528202 RepID=A0A4R1BFK5_9PROT|nr:TRAP transporter small permease subunit [Parasulfuritortus cantonensis]TCJ15976.1 TRAP transporter small permease subunit [Parasulfuritortus cantonensis]
MRALLRLSGLIDALNERVGRLAMWLVLAAVVVSAGNAVFRKALNMSSNAWLEIQWYMFAAIFLFGAGYTLKHNGHVRIDILYGRLAARTRAWVDLVGGLLFLLPTALLIAWLGWTGFAESYAIGETSPDAGGLLRWPVRLAIPLGFGLLALQGISETIKRAAFLAGKAPLADEAPEETV